MNLTTGRSGLVLDVVVKDGNPADSARCVPMLERHVAHYGAVPTHAAFDGGYASRENLEAARALGVAHAVFHKKRGMKAEDMTPSSWVHAQLKRFRAGIEAGISYLKRCFGLDRCRWRGPAHFKAYVQGGGGGAQPGAAGASGTRARLNLAPPRRMPRMATIRAPALGSAAANHPARRVATASRPKTDVPSARPHVRNA